MNFKKMTNDRYIGEHYENEVVRILLSKFKQSKNINNFDFLGFSNYTDRKEADCNFIRNNTFEKYEVKTEFRRDLENFYLMTEKVGKPSGVSTSIADYWVFNYPNRFEMYIIKFDDIKYIVEHPEEFDSRFFNNQSQYNNNKAYLVNINSIRKKFKVTQLKYTDEDIEQGDFILNKLKEIKMNEFTKWEYNKDDFCAADLENRQK